MVAEVEDPTACRSRWSWSATARPDERTAALLRATREALVNAVRHGRPPVSLYLEVGPAEVEVFVKDRGDGFDLDAVPEDRFGVRESIIGRMTRAGRQARVRSRPEGTEVAAEAAGGRSRRGAGRERPDRRRCCVDDHLMFRTGVRASLDGARPRGRRGGRRGLGGRA